MAYRAGAGIALRVLVTGGAGFIGTRLVERLVENGDEVFVLDARQAPAIGWDRCVELLGRERVLLGDVSSPVSVSGAIYLAAPDVVLHLAAQSHVDASISDPAATILTNALGTHFVAMTCARSQIPLVYCSTDEVYGDAHGRDVASREHDALEPSSPYSASKASGELLVRAVSRTYGLRFAITRGTNAFGTGQYGQKLVPIACRLLTQSHRVPLHGGGEQIRQWVHVDEFAQCLELAARALVANDERVVGAALNIAGPVRCSVRELVELLAERVGVPTHEAHETVADRPGGDVEYSVDGSLARDVLGFEATRKITDSNELDELLAAYSGERFVEIASYGGAE